jgi:hypothetical protein
MQSISVAAPSKEHNVFYCSTSEFVDSSLARGMDVRLHFPCVCVFFCVGIVLTMGRPPFQGVLPAACEIHVLY